MINHQGSHYVLIDYLQEYASSMAKTGALLKDTVYARESVNQFLIYEELLRNSSNGLWRQGRGWCADSEKLSTGAWSRGHGWLLRGLVSSMLYLPESYANELQPLLKRVAHSLKAVQSSDGMYHILLHLPADQSAPDVSGTGMIAYYLSLAIKEGWLDRKDYASSVLQATKALRQWISIDGEILSSGKGPGPLCHDLEYIHYVPEINEKHGFQGAIYGMLGEYLLDR